MSIKRSHPVKKLYILLGLLSLITVSGLQRAEELPIGIESNLDHKVIGEVLDAANLGMAEGSTGLDQVVGSVGKENASEAFVKAVEEVSPLMPQLSNAGKQLHALAADETEDGSLTQELKNAKQELVKWIVRNPKEALKTTMQAIVALMAAKKAYDAGGRRGLIEHGLGFKQGALGSGGTGGTAENVQASQLDQEWGAPPSYDEAVKIAPYE